MSEARIPIGFTFSRAWMERLGKAMRRGDPLPEPEYQLIWEDHPTKAQELAFAQMIFDLNGIDPAQCMRAPDEEAKT